MFRALIYPSSGVCDYVVDLPHRLYFSCCVLELGCCSARVVSVLPAGGDSEILNISIFKANILKYVICWYVQLISTSFGNFNS